MSPGVNATNVGPYSPVTLTFNKSLDYTTITAANFVMYNGPTQLNPTIGYSTDRRTVTLSGTLPYAASIQLAVNTSVKDYAGNNMANAYQASFTTQAAPVSGAVTVTQSRPGSNAAINTPITLFMSAPMKLSTVQAGMYVAQNGVLISGTPTLTADLRGITWTPSSPYLPGALIEVDLTPTATDTSGNPATDYRFSFTTTAAAATAPTEIAYSPARSATVTATNSVIEVQFSTPLNPATVNSTTVKVTKGSSAGGAVVTGTVTLLSNNTVVRFTPSPPLQTNAYIFVALTNGIQDAIGNAFAGDAGYYILVSSAAVLDNTPPTLVSATPTNGSTGIGDNAPIRLVFSKLMDALSINSGTAQLLNGATPIPWTATFSTLTNPVRTVATLLPQSPLPDSSTITLQVTTGIWDLTGAAISAQSLSFTTEAGADFTAPYVIQQSIDSHNNTNVPTNATFTLVFNKPLDPSTVIANTLGGVNSGFYILDRVNCGSVCFPPVTTHVSPDGRTVTIVPNAGLGASQTSDDYYAQNATDLNGNPQTNFGQIFATAATANLTGPTIVATNPLSTNAGTVPTNTAIEVIFSAPVSGTSLGAVTLTGGAGGAYSVILNNAFYTDDTVIRIVPQSLLLPNTTYTVNVTGVKDVAGNAAATTTFSFTTGPNFQNVGLNLVTATITPNGGGAAIPLPGSPTIVSGVADSPTITLTFDHAVDYATLLHNGITLRDAGNTLVTNVTLTFALSTDQKTVTITTSGLAAAATYHLVVGYFTDLYDISANDYQNYAFLYFTTH